MLKKGTTVQNGKNEHGGQGERQCQNGHSKTTAEGLFLWFHSHFHTVHRSDMGIGPKTTGTQAKGQDEQYLVLGLYP